MNREEFEKEYVKRHMGYDPRSQESKLASIERLRDIDGYSDSHVDLCWKIQKAKNEKGIAKIAVATINIEW